MRIWHGCAAAGGGRGEAVWAHWPPGTLALAKQSWFYKKNALLLQLHNQLETIKELTIPLILYLPLFLRTFNS